MRTRCGGKRIWLTIVVVLGQAVIAYQAPGQPAEKGAGQSAHPFLKTLADSPGGVAIAYGTEPGSRQAARVIGDAIRSIPGHERWDEMGPAAQFDKLPKEKAGQTHVIAVGTLADNAVMRGRNWLPTWWMDRDWYYHDYEYAVPEVGRLNYQKTSGFIVGGFGEWDKGSPGVGVIEVDRSFYFMEWIVRTRLEKVLPEGHKARPIRDKKDWPSYPRDFPLRLMVRISGSSQDGVMAAAHGLADDQMLNGVVLAKGAKAQEGPTMFTLPASRYAARLPFDPPSTVAGYAYQGWLLPSAFHYDGFRRNAGVEAKQMFRVKYKPPFGITNFWTSPNRRASQFEIAAIKLASPAAAAKAKANLSKHLASTKSFKQGRIKGFNMTATGDKLYLESIPEGENDAGSKILKRFVDRVGNDW